MQQQNIDISIKCDDNVLQEYDVKDDDDGIPTCFIASEAGKRFKISHQNNSENEFDIEVYFDGKFIDSWLVSPHNSGTIDGVRINRDSKRPFLFSNLQLTDDESALREGHSLEDIGTIEMKYFRCERRGTSDSVTRSDRPYQTVGENPVHERTKKAGAHTVTLGDALQSQFVGRIHVHHFDAKDAPYARFIWRYRPKELLQAQGVISSATGNRRHHSPTPTAGPSSRPAKRMRKDKGPARDVTELVRDSPSVKSDDVEEIELDALVFLRQAQRAAIDAQIKVAQKKKVRGVKQEGASFHLPKDVVGQVIDLTSD